MGVDGGFRDRVFMSEQHRLLFSCLLNLHLGRVKLDLSHEPLIISPHKLILYISHSQWGVCNCSVICFGLEITVTPHIWEKMLLLPLRRSYT